MGQVGPPLVWAYYGVFALAYARVPLVRTVRRWTARVSSLTPSMRLENRPISWWAVALVASIAALLWIAALSTADDRLHVSFIDVGQGDAAFITTPGGKQVLVDGGPDPVEVVQYLGERMPFRDRTIELVVLTHAHNDHVNGLMEVLRRYDVERILQRETDYESPPYEAWRRAVAEEGAEVIQAEAEQVIAVDGGVFIQVLSPPARLLRGTSSDVDNASVVLRLVYRDLSFLLTGDMFGEAEAVLVRESSPVDSDVLKVGHHGSRTSSSEAFLERVTPAIGIISAGEDNRFGHPHPETMEALRRHVPEDLLFLTKDRGTIELITDGKRLEVKTER